MPFRPPPGAPPLQPEIQPFRPGDGPSGGFQILPAFQYGSDPTARPQNLGAKGFPAAAYGGTYDQGPVIVGEQGPELAMASPSGLLEVQPISQGQAQSLAAPQQMPTRPSLIGSAARQPGASRGAATGGTFTTTSYSDPQLVNAPPIQQLQAR